MAHYSRVHKVVVDVVEADHDQEVRFWEAATGITLRHNERFPEYHGAFLAKEGFGFLVQRLGDGRSGVHLDIHTTDLEAEVARLEGLGATRVRQVNTWWVMRDPAGLAFCVLPAASGSLDDTNAQRWD
ncbi:VOC family protein [Sphaerisporangium corydalis]|uniref:VOC family protein n=1 Tax=Sphaerisporangium corydalis TaxID=1441875 RepID=A0ABV9EIX6_9ACTN|nr:VOC family protein [Sphaerisporangium corydalis]